MLRKTCGTCSVKDKTSVHSLRITILMRFNAFLAKHVKYTCFQQWSSKRIYYQLSDYVHRHPLHTCIDNEISAPIIIIGFASPFSALVRSQSQRYYSSNTTGLILYRFHNTLYIIIIIIISSFYTFEIR